MFLRIRRFLRFALEFCVTENRLDARTFNDRNMMNFAPSPSNRKNDLIPQALDTISADDHTTALDTKKFQTKIPPLNLLSC